MVHPGLTIVFLLWKKSTKNPSKKQNKAKQIKAKQKKKKPKKTKKKKTKQTNPAIKTNKQKRVKLPITRKCFSLYIALPAHIWAFYFIQHSYWNDCFFFHISFSYIYIYIYIYIGTYKPNSTINFQTSANVLKWLLLLTIFIEINLKVNATHCNGTDALLTK